MDRELLKKYAEFAVKSGVAVQKGQSLIINCTVENAEIARLCAEAGYDAGAKEVVVFYGDQQLSRIQMERTDVEVLEHVYPYQLRRYMDYVESDGGMCILNLSSRDPEIFKGLDTEKINRVNQASSVAMRPFQELTMGSHVQWCVLGIPNPAWAKLVFPNDDAETGVEKLWDAIFKVSRVEGGDPVGAWKTHVATLSKNRDWLNAIDLESLHLTAANGTDVVIGLADDAVWEGAGESSTDGVYFLPNIPTEEVFTAPHREKVDGVVHCSMPYVYNGNLIEGIRDRFEAGRVVEYSAEKGGELLDQMMSFDDGARSIGEIALVPASSPIRETGLLFYNTLFDENAACHMAFGAAYPSNVRGGNSMTREELTAKGANDSLMHEDVMIGTEDMDIVGTTREGKAVQIFKNGEWANA